MSKYFDHLMMTCENFNETFRSEQIDSQSVMAKQAYTHWAGRAQKEKIDPAKNTLVFDEVQSEPDFPISQQTIDTLSILKEASKNLFHSNGIECSVSLSQHGLVYTFDFSNGICASTVVQFLWGNSIEEAERYILHLHNSSI